MKVINIDKVSIKNIATLLKKGDIMVCPTETSYGFSCDATNKEAIKRIYIIKERPKKKSVLLICADLEMVKKYFFLSDEELKLASRYWPGPLSLILKPKSKKLKSACWQNQNRSLNKLGTSFGVRIPAHNLCRKISKELGKPITTTSANLADKPPCYSVKCIKRQFGKKKNKPDLVIDGGRLKKVRPSTIIKIVRGKIKVLREGHIKL